MEVTFLQQYWIVDLEFSVKISQLADLSLSKCVYLAMQTSSYSRQGIDNRWDLYFVGVIQVTLVEYFEEGDELAVGKCLYPLADNFAYFEKYILTVLLLTLHT